MKMDFSNKSNSEVFPSFLTPWRLKWYPRAFLFAFAVGFLIALLSGHDASTLTGRLGGDYPAFYGAGRIIVQGDWDNLYNLKKQSAIQKDFYPGEGNVFMPFPYPPFVAVAYYPLSLMPYRLSYAVHTILMVVALFLAIFLLGYIHKYIRQNYLFIACIALSFYPMFRAVFGGQNTAITLLLIVLGWRAVSAKKDLLAGMILGLLLFKPQFGLPLIGLHLISGRWLVGIGSLFTALILYGIGALISGPMWVTEWYRFTSWLSQADAGINYDKAVSWLGFFQAILGWKNHLALFLGWATSVITAIFVALAWLIGRSRADLTAQLGIAVATLMLIPPHVNYYDIGLVLFTCLAIVGMNAKKPWVPLGLLWIFCFSQPLGSILGFSPLFFVALSVMILSVYFCFKSATRHIDSH
jgi:hypothetical protein